MILHTPGLTPELGFLGGEAPKCGGTVKERETAGEGQRVGIRDTARSPDFGAEKTHGFHAMMGKLRLRGETSLSGPIYGR